MYGPPKNKSNEFLQREKKPRTGGARQAAAGGADASLGPSQPLGPSWGFFDHCGPECSRREINLATSGGGMSCHATGGCV
jgi:hypothetical protein